MTTPEPCTTESRRKLHWSAKLQPDRRAPRQPGRAGTTLCGQSGRDEERANAPMRMYSPEHGGWEMVPRRRPVVVTELPACGLCAKAKAKEATP